MTPNQELKKAYEARFKKNSISQIQSLNLIKLFSEITGIQEEEMTAKIHEFHVEQNRTKHLLNFREEGEITYFIPNRKK